VGVLEKVRKSPATGDGLFVMAVHPQRVRDDLGE
jgi:hypothetical protein